MRQQVNSIAINNRTIFYFLPISRPANSQHKLQLSSLRSGTSVLERAMHRFFAPLGTSTRSGLKNRLVIAAGNHSASPQKCSRGLELGAALTKIKRNTGSFRSRAKVQLI